VASPGFTQLLGATFMSWAGAGCAGDAAASWGARDGTAGAGVSVARVLGLQPETITATIAVKAALRAIEIDSPRTRAGAEREWLSKALRAPHANC
jgi:hypothetical protein